MKKTGLVLSIIALIIAASAMAQPPGQQGQPRGFTIEDQVNRLTEDLELTDEQVEQVTEIFENSEWPDIMERMEAAEDHDARREIMDEMREAMDEVNEQIKEILTEDQLTKFEEMLTKRQRGGPPPGGGRGDGPRRG